MPFTPSHQQLRAEIEASIEDFLGASEASLADAAPLYDEIRRMLAAGGKRIRPLFCYWGYRGAGGVHDERIVRAAGALELLHTFALVHDDIMDAADERRGEKTVHHLHGVPVALLVGDLALVLADDVLITAGFGGAELLAGLQAYGRMRREVIAGQYLDVQADAATSVATARRIATLKSGRYSVQEPLVIGAALAGANDELMSALAAFGEPVGEAFQLRDDLLGSFGERSVVGKPTDSDIREGKRNILFAEAAARLDGSEREFFLSRWGGGSELSDEDVTQLRALLESSGARAEIERLVYDLTSTARNLLKNLEIGDGTRAALAELLDAAVTRNA